MAGTTTTIAADEISSGVLTTGGGANVDTISFDGREALFGGQDPLDPNPVAVVVSLDGADKLWISNDGTPPTVGGKNCQLVLAQQGARAVIDLARHVDPTIKVISTNATQYVVLLGSKADLSAGALPPANVTLAAGDVEIGAVEIKDGSADTRAKVAAGSALVVGDNALAVGDANVLAKLTTIDTHVDGLETLLTPAAGTVTQVADITVDATAGGVVLLAANSSRKSATIQNTAAPGGANMRVRIDGNPAAATGIQLAPGATLSLSMPNCPTGAIKAIREGAVSTTAATLEVV